MDLEQQVRELRKRIQTLRNQLETKETNTLVVEEPTPEPKQSAAELYKAQLLKKSN